MLIFGKLCSPPEWMLDAVSLTDQEIPEIQQTKAQCKNQRQMLSVEGAGSDGCDVCLTSNRLSTPADLLNVIIFIIIIINQDAVHCTLGFFQLNEHADICNNYYYLKKKKNPFRCINDTQRFSIDHITFESEIIRSQKKFFFLFSQSISSWTDRFKKKKLNNLKKSQWVQRVVQFHTFYGVTLWPLICTQYSIKTKQNPL